LGGLPGIRLPTFTLECTLIGRGCSRSCALHTPLPSCCPFSPYDGHNVLSPHGIWVALQPAVSGMARCASCLPAGGSSIRGPSPLEHFRSTSRCLLVLLIMALTLVLPSGTVQKHSSDSPGPVRIDSLLNASIFIQFKPLASMSSPSSLCSKPTWEVF